MPSSHIVIPTTHSTSSTMKHSFLSIGNERNWFYDEFFAECREILQKKPIDIPRYIKLLNHVRKAGIADGWMNLDDYAAIAYYGIDNIDQANAYLNKNSEIAKLYIETKKGTFVTPDVEQFIQTCAKWEKNINPDYMCTEALLVMSLMYHTAGDKQKAIEYMDLAEKSRKEWIGDLDIPREAASSYLGEQGLMMVFSYMLQAVSHRIITDSITNP